MTYNQLLEIKGKLEKWKAERNLTAKEQQERFLQNFKDKFYGEYLILSSSKLEKMEALCDMAILILKAFDFSSLVKETAKDLSRNIIRDFSRDELEQKEYIIIEGSLSDIMQNISFLQYFYDTNKSFSNADKGCLATCFILITNINSILKCEGFDFYECLTNAIKDLDNKKEKWSETIANIQIEIIGNVHVNPDSLKEQSTRKRRSKKCT